MSVIRRARNRRRGEAPPSHDSAPQAAAEPSAEPMAHPVLEGQRLLGNQAVLRLLSQGPLPPVFPGTRPELGNQALQRLLLARSAGVDQPAVTLAPLWRPAHSSVARSRPTLQRFNANEHKQMGDQGSATAAGKPTEIKLSSGLTVTFGDITAMAGDLFGSVKEIQAMASKPGPGVGTEQEIEYALLVKVRRTKKDADFPEAIVNAVTKRYYTLAGKNVTHFSNPETGDASLGFGAKAAKRDKAGNTVNNAGSYHENHVSAIKEAVTAGKTGAPLDAALLYEAFASHFLTDAYSSGHLRTARASIAEWWNARVPMFWLNLKWWMAENIARHLNDNATIPSIATEQILWEQSRSTLDAVVNKKGIPDLTFGDAISGAVHDMDNEKGVMATVGKDVVKLMGDGQVLDDQDRALAAGVDTGAKAAAGVKASLKDIHDAYAKGKAGGEPEAVAAALKLGDGLYRAEQLFPKALPDSDPRQANKSLKWQVNTVDELFTDPLMCEALAHFANGKADTLGAEIQLDPPFKAEKTMAMKEGVLDRLKAGTADVVKVFKQIINYTPGSVYGGIGGIGGHDTDDNAVEYWEEAKKVKKKTGIDTLATLTLPQRKKLLKDVLDGVTVGDDEKVALDVLTTANGQMKELIDSVSWRRIWKKIDGDNNRKFIRACGPSYWAADSFNGKKAEIKWLANGRTNDIAQETIIIILRTCSGPAEVRKIDDQVGGWTGLSFDLTGQWQDEFDRLRRK